MDKKNIIVGAAAVYLGASGSTSAPATVAGTSYRTTLDGDADWRNVGYTQDGLEVSTDPSFGEVEVDQLLDSAKMFQDGMSVSIATTFAEATLENLLVAWGQTDDTLTSSGTGASKVDTLVMDAGALGAAPVERGLIAVGNSVEKTGSNQYGERIYHAYRVLSVEGSTHSLSRAEATTIPVTFRALPEDMGDGTARYGTVRDRLTA